MVRGALAALLALGLASSGLAGEGSKKGADEGKKGKRPYLELRALPRFSFSPVNIHFTAELTGGDDIEELYCPEVEWEWGDGGKSDQESECAPFEAGTKIDRRFSAEHLYQFAGRYLVKVTLRKADKTLSLQTLQLTVRPGVGDRSNEAPNN